MNSKIILILGTAIISLIAGAGIAYVAIPTIDPSYNTESSNSNSGQTSSQPVYKSWQDESYIFDNQLNWNLMNQTQVNFTIGANSKIFVQFSAPFLLSLDASFTGIQYYLVALVIQGVVNTTVPIVYTDTSVATGQYHEQTYNPTLTIVTNNLPTGTYNCSVQWKSLNDAPGTNDLSVSHHNLNGSYHYDRWMILEEIKS